MKWGGTCPSCGVCGRVGERFCGECGVRLAEKLDSGREKACLKCCATLAPHWLFCYSCGTQTHRTHLFLPSQDPTLHAAVRSVFANFVVRTPPRQEQTVDTILANTVNGTYLPPTGFFGAVEPDTKGKSFTYHLNKKNLPFTALFGTADATGRAMREGALERDAAKIRRMRIPQQTQFTPAPPMEKRPSGRVTATDAAILSHILSVPTESKRVGRKPEDPPKQKIAVMTQAEVRESAARLSTRPPRKQITKKPDAKDISAQILKRYAARNVPSERLHEYFMNAPLTKGFTPKGFKRLVTAGNVKIRRDHSGTTLW